MQVIQAAGPGFIHAQAADLHATATIVRLMLTVVALPKACPCPGSTKMCMHKHTHCQPEPDLQKMHETKQSKAKQHNKQSPELTSHAAATSTQHPHPSPHTYNCQNSTSKNTSRADIHSPNHGLTAGETHVHNADSQANTTPCMPQTQGRMQCPKIIRAPRPALKDYYNVTSTWTTTPATQLHLHCCCATKHCFQLLLLRLQKHLQEGTCASNPGENDR